MLFEFHFVCVLFETMSFYVKLLEGIMIVIFENHGDLVFLELYEMEILGALFKKFWVVNLFMDVIYSIFGNYEKLLF